MSFFGVRFHGLMPLAPLHLLGEKPRQGRIHHLDNWLPLQCGGTVFYHQHQGVCLVVTKRTWGGAGRRRPGLVVRPQTDGRTYAELLGVGGGEKSGLVVVE